MAILDRKDKTGDSPGAAQQEHGQPFAEIDAKKFDRAQRDPKIQKVLHAADRHMETLLAEGRID